MLIHSPTSSPVASWSCPVPQKPCVPSQEPVLLARAVIELELQRELDAVVCVRPVHVVLKGVIENREDALRRA